MLQVAAGFPLQDSAFIQDWLGRGGDCVAACYGADCGCQSMPSCLLLTVYWFYAYLTKSPELIQSQT